MQGVTRIWARILIIIVQYFAIQLTTVNVQCFATNVRLSIYLYKRIRWCWWFLLMFPPGRVAYQNLCTWLSVVRIITDNNYYHVNKWEYKEAQERHECIQSNDMNICMYTRIYMHILACTCTKKVARKAYVGSDVLFFEEFGIEFLSERVCSTGNFYFATVT